MTSALEYSLVSEEGSTAGSWEWCSIVAEQSLSALESFSAGVPQTGQTNG
jgi:hypothetical protein